MKPSKQPKRRLGRIKRRSRIRAVSKKRAKRNRVAKKVRAEFCRQIGACELCEQVTIDLAGHEIPRGNRVAAFTESCAMLALCNECHRTIHDFPALWPKVKQAALLMLRRPGDWDLEALNRLLIARLEQWAVDAAADEIRRQWRAA